MFGTLAIVVAAGLLGPLLGAGRRPLLPVVVGELVAGVVLGRTGFGIISVASSPAFPVFYGLGFAMLMLVAGTHINLQSPAFRKGAPRGATAFLAVVAASVPLGYAISRLLGVGSFAMLAVLLAGSSAALAFPIIEERGLQGPAISTLVAWIAVADSITVVLLSLTLSGPRQVVPAIIGDAAIIVAAVAIYAAARRVVFTAGALSTWNTSRERGWALQFRLSLLLLLVLGTIADRTGASTLVAGFVAGMVLARLHQPDRLEIQFIGIANGFFVPIFFLLLGARIDLRSLAADPSAIGVALAMAVGAVAVHLLGALFAGKQQRVASGLAASAQLGLPAAAASLGLANHLLTPALAAALVAAGCLTLIPASIGGVLLARGSGQA